MKRIVAWMLLFVLLLALSPAVLTDRAGPDLPQKGTFVFPASLREVGEEAFSGVSAETLVFREALHSLGERAFAGAAALKAVLLPAAAVEIADTAFAGASELAVFGEEGSLSQLWAKSHELAFLPAAAWRLLVGGARAVSHQTAAAVRAAQSLIHSAPERQSEQRREGAERSMRPQDRPELYPIEYRFP